MNLKDLANLLGLSQTTVSRAINGYSDVSERTRARVLEAATKHGYTPNLRARSLATGRAMAIGLVIPVDSRQERVNPVFNDFVAGAGDVLSSRGYDIVLSPTTEADEADTYVMIAARGRVDGLVIQAPLTGDWRNAILRELGIPFVVHGRFSEADSTYSWVDMDNRRAFHKATEHLLDLGHTRIALLNGVSGMDFVERRLAGYSEALVARGLGPDPGKVFNAPMTETYGFEVASALFDGDAPPTALITSSILVAMGVRRAAEQRGLALGRDISLVTHDDDLAYLPNGGSPPEFTATRSSVRRHGETVSDTLVRLIENPDDGPIQTMLDAEFLLGASSGPAPETLPDCGRSDVVANRLS